MEIVLLLIGIICIAYGIFVTAAHAGTMFFLVWELIGVVLVGIAVGKHFDLLSRIPQPLKVTFLCFCSICALLLVITLPIVLSGFSGNMERDAQYVIVLGAQVRKSGPSRVLRYRLDTAADYLSRHPETKCICSGGKGWNEPDAEANVMRDYLIDKGVLGDRIQVETRSGNTTENMKFSLEMIKGDDPCVGIITNNFHAKRAGFLAHGAGINNSFTIAAPSSAAYLPNNVLRECVAMVKDFLFGNFR